MDFLKRLLRPKPWQELEKNFVLILNCEECGVETKTLSTVDGLLCCKDCAEANDRRARFLQEEEEWEESQNES
jgi:hypothetical protein